MSAPIPDFHTVALDEAVSQDKMVNGKSLKAVKQQAVTNWKNLPFEQDGKRIDYVVTMETDVGTIELEFFPDIAPSHVRGFLALVQAGFYDGLTFHRCIAGFMIQGGCPLGNGTGGPGYRLKQEFNATKHVRGVLSAARSRSPDSAGCQFFICVANADFLDNQYTAYGKVTKGMEVADKIVQTGDANDNGRVDKPYKIVKATDAVKGA